MNRIFKRKLVFVEVCSPFSFIRFTNTEKNLKKKKDVRRSLSWVQVLQVRVLQVHVLLVWIVEYKFIVSIYCEFTLWGRDLVSVVRIRESPHYRRFFLKENIWEFCRDIGNCS